MGDKIDWDIDKLEEMVLGWEKANGDISRVTSEKIKTLSSNKLDEMSKHLSEENEKLLDIKVYREQIEVSLDEYEDE